MPYTVVDKGSKYFNTVLYTGDGAFPRTITGVGFQPDFSWIKNRDGVETHEVYDAVRGALKKLTTNTTAGDETRSNGLQSWNSDGFVLGNTAVDNNVNKSANKFVSWNFLGANTTVSNTSGTITSTVSANTTSGFSIVSYTGTGTTAQTVGHGLGVEPSMIIIKNRSAVTDWRVYHKSLGVNGSYPNFLELDLTTASNTGDSGNFASVPTSSLFGVGNYNVVNGNGNSMIAYCFAEVKGYSKFGSYTGNGSADGTFVYTGFKPAFIMIKVSSTTENWVIRDNKRDTFNNVYKQLLPNASSAEDTSNDGRFSNDFLSNGFKLRATHATTNQSGATYIYMAFAENPFVSSKGIPTTAR
jgi:hypothetical protein